MSSFKMSPNTDLYINTTFITRVAYFSSFKKCLHNSWNNWT